MGDIMDRFKDDKGKYTVAGVLTIGVIIFAGWYGWKQGWFKMKL